MSEPERFISLLEQIVKYQKSALDRLACEQSAAGFNLQDLGLPEEKLAICFLSLYHYRQKAKALCTKIGGCSYYYFPDLPKRDIPEKSILVNATLLHKFVVYRHRVNC